jgi:hypothetical protein
LGFPCFSMVFHGLPWFSCKLSHQSIDFSDVFLWIPVLLRPDWRWPVSFCGYPLYPRLKIIY